MPHIDLLELPYFKDMSVEMQVELVDHMVPIEFGANQTIFHQGSTTDASLFIVTHGKIQISKAISNGKSRPIAELDAPTLVGEIELFCRIPAVASATAQTRVSAFKLDAQAFDSLFHARSRALLQFTFNISCVACHRLAIANEMLVQALPTADLITLQQSVFPKTPLATPPHSND